MCRLFSSLNNTITCKMQQCSSFISKLDESKANYGWERSITHPRCSQIHQHSDGQWLNSLVLAAWSFSLQPLQPSVEEKRVSSYQYLTQISHKAIPTKFASSIGKVIPRFALICKIICLNLYFCISWPLCLQTSTCWGVQTLCSAIPEGFPTILYNYFYIHNICLRN